MRIIVYTVNIGGYDIILPPLFKIKSFRYICLTDVNTFGGHGWECIVIPKDISMLGNNLASRYYKMFPWEILPEHDISIYIDGNIRLLKDPSKLVKDFIESGVKFAVPAHPVRNVIGEEFRHIKQSFALDLIEIDALDSQFDRYMRLKDWKTSVLTENNIIFRRCQSDNELYNAMGLWWREFAYSIKRDQLSLSFALHTYNIEYLVFNREDIDGIFGRVNHTKGRTDWLASVQARRFHSWFYRVIYNIIIFIAKCKNNWVHHFHAVKTLFGNVW